MLHDAGKAGTGNAWTDSPLEILDRREALEFVRRHRHLFDREEAVNPFAGSAWHLHFLEQVARDDWRFLAPCSPEGSSGLMLLCAERPGLGRWQAVANCYTGLYSPLIAGRGGRQARISTLVDQLMDRRSGCASLRLSPLDGDSPDTLALERALDERCWYWRRYFVFGNWYLRCRGLSFEDYMAGRDSRLYNTWRRKAKKFHDPASGGRLELVTASGDVDRAMDAYERVYGRSWKKPEAYPRFAREWARACAERGWLRLGLAWIGDVPVAAQFWFTLHGRANIFKLAYDEDYAGWSAGTILTAHMIRHSLDADRVAEIDFLSGDDPYKRSWMDRRRERVGILACNLHRVAGIVLAAEDAARQRIRTWRDGTGVPARPLAPLA